MPRIIMITLILMLIPANVSDAQSVPAAPSAVSQYASTTPPTVPVFGWNTSQNAPAVLIVPSADLSGERAGELAEDLNVMCAVFDKLLGDAGVETRSWSSRVGYYRRHERSCRCVYLPDFGPLFLIEVDFPLAARREALSPDETQSEDALWAEVRSNMHSPRTGANYHENQMLIEYDNLKVESLKRTLRRAVKHASNVRHLGPNEQIVAMVIESPSSRHTAARIATGSGRGYSGYTSVVAMGSRPTNIVSVRSSKKEVDALAKGQIDAAAFDATVDILSYELPLLQNSNEPAQGRR